MSANVMMRSTDKSDREFLVENYVEFQEKMNICSKCKKLTISSQRKEAVFNAKPNIISFV